LVSPGGDAWLRSFVDGPAGHQALARYLIEEAYEAYDAISAHDLAALREELGDVLLQVVLHARLAEEADEADEAWSVDDLAGALVDKLVRRNPHVFDGAAVAGVDEITDNWERIKREEKARESALDGIALAQPALSLAAKVLDRARRAHLPVPVEPADLDGQDLGAALLALVAAAGQRDLDAEGALRRAALALADALRAAEAG
jgi:XTP/dITP diphosphohydrolase